MLFSESLSASAGCTPALRLSFANIIDQECTGLILGAVEETELEMILKQVRTKTCLIMESLFSNFRVHGRCS